MIPKNYIGRNKPFQMRHLSCKYEERCAKECVSKDAAHKWSLTNDFSLAIMSVIR